MDARQLLKIHRGAFKWVSVCDENGNANFEQGDLIRNSEIEFIVKSKMQDGFIEPDYDKVYFISSDCDRPIEQLIRSHNYCCSPLICEKLVEVKLNKQESEDE